MIIEGKGFLSHAACGIFISILLCSAHPYSVYAQYRKNPKFDLCQYIMMSGKESI